MLDPVFDIYSKLSPWIVWGILVFGLHFWALSRAWSHRTWLYLEYVWLLSTILVFIGAAAAAQRLRLESSASVAAKWVETREEIARITLQSCSSEYLDDSRYENFAPESRWKIAGYKAFGTWCQTVMAALEGDNSELRTVLASQTDFSDIRPPRLTEVVHAVGELVSSRATAGELEARRAPSGAELVSILLLPWLLPVTISLPLTKVTCQLKGRIH